ncbi:hypothetical protein [Mesorhizobium sp. B2-8-5]|uniref:hypothetical protein n=1 Tax=Mesorhizobium sp. B2-8-5 TaxID=2589903 RepID=UPI001126200E|nr:hypothetical protein [Mesorhizobium sp. B2-8-5]UCI23512.1 hypothetical protein FJ430_18000 [Mesorhizobium sp. B2-8-5]
MKYPDRMGRRGTGSRPFHTVISITFSIEFAAYEQIMLPQLMTSGATNLLVIADERMVSMSLSDGSQLPVQLGRDYELFSPPVTAGVFHPKIVLQIGRRAGRLFVGSANITAAGLAGNVEAIIELECQDEAGPEREIVRSAWRYLQSLVPSDVGAARDAIDWAFDRAPWLLGPEPDPIQQLEDGSVIAFLSNDGNEGIGRRFADLVGNEAVERLVVASPYWDNGLSALGALMRSLEAETTSILLDLSQHEFPIDASAPSDLQFRELPRELHGRFAHAKVAIATTATHDHVLVGSANCTEAALGRGRAVGTNAEACIYRRLPRNKAVEALGLDACLEDDPLDAEDIKQGEAAPPIPLEKIASLRPGSFELEGDRLVWSHLAGIGGSGSLRLLDTNAVEIGAIPFDPIDGEAPRSFRATIENPERISFVVVTAEGFVSNPAHVTHRSMLRRRRREAASGAVAKAVAIFDRGEDFDLRMHQAFDELARADLTDRKHVHVTASRPRPTSVAPEQQFAHLTYEEFMETRSPDNRGDGQRDSTLVGMHSDSIRGFLNVLVGRAAEGAKVDDPSGDHGWMELGDEDEDRELDATTRKAEVKAADAPDDEVGAAVDARMFERMVQAYASNIRSNKGPLGSSDVLRLRFWLMLLLQKARHAKLPMGLEATVEETGWPRMALRVIAAFFCGKGPPVTRLMISRKYTEMPIDFLESWTTVLWSLDAIDASVAASPRNRQFLIYVQKLRAEVLKILGLTSSELMSNTMVELRQALDRTVGTRLGCQIGIVAQ